jgi:hypothetical protein
MNYRKPAAGQSAGFRTQYSRDVEMPEVKTSMARLMKVLMLRPEAEELTRAAARLTASAVASPPVANGTPLP